MCVRLQVVGFDEGRHSYPVVRPGFKPGWGRQPLPGRFDSGCLPPHGPFGPFRPLCRGNHKASAWKLIGLKITCPIYISLPYPMTLGYDRS